MLYFLLPSSYYLLLSLRSPFFSWACVDFCLWQDFYYVTSCLTSQFIWAFRCCYNLFSWRRKAATVCIQLMALCLFQWHFSKKRYHRLCKFILLHAKNWDLTWFLTGNNFSKWMLYLWASGPKHLLFVKSSKSYNYEISFTKF